MSSFEKIIGKIFRRGLPRHCREAGVDPVGQEKLVLGVRIVGSGLTASFWALLWDLGAVDVPRIRCVDTMAQWRFHSLLSMTLGDVSVPWRGGKHDRSGTGSG